ncbi:MAG: G5 domain-containing protein, partial [Actinobacteria bacterium]|nr:G5 domain-containing protein [Actinomycetota bacterium]
IRMVSKTVAIPSSTTTQSSPALRAGTTKVQTAGVNGTATETWQQTVRDGPLPRPGPRGVLADRPAERGRDHRHLAGRGLTGVSADRQVTGIPRSLKPTAAATTRATATAVSTSSGVQLIASTGIFGVCANGDTFCTQLGRPMSGPSSPRSTTPARIAHPSQSSRGSQATATSATATMTHTAGRCANAGLASRQ